MTTLGVERSFEPVTNDDLRRALDRALAKFEDVFARLPDGAGVFEGRLALLCFCQGAALHLAEGRRGVKDFDVWGFFRPVEGKTFPVRARWTTDFGPSSHGRHPDDPLTFRGRRIDVLGRDLPFQAGEDEAVTLRRYLEEGRTDTARLLAWRPVYALWPDSRFGEIIWTMEDVARKAPPIESQTPPSDE